MRAGVLTQKSEEAPASSASLLATPMQRRESASGRRGCIAAGYPRKARENKRSHTDSISPSLAAEGALHE